MDKTRSIISTQKNIDQGIVCPDKQAKFTEENIAKRNARFEALYAVQKERIKTLP